MIKKKFHNYRGFFDWSSPKKCLEFVKDHRNIFSDSTRRYILNSCPVTIKEIDRKGDNVNYWYWIFSKEGFTILQLDHKPSRLELNQIWYEIERIYLEMIAYEQA